MASEVFVDTSGFYSLLVKGDSRHHDAARLLATAGRRRERFVTTDYVLDETATLLSARGHRHLVPPWLDATLSSSACRVEWTGPDRFHEVAELFVKRLDKAWSFTDCLSFRVMARLGLKKALTTDVHFEHAGFQRLL
jgi:predicted nucleic acid-binding protein